ncbi:MAG: hypothetical protein ACRDTU_02900 [Micromonosporaceae bacterium]
MNRLRILLCVAGTGLVGYGGYGVFTDERGPDAVRYAGFVAAGLLGHDLVVAPVGLLIGGLVARWSRPGLRGPLAGGLFVSVAVTLIALPLALGYGARPDDPSALPLNYGRGLLLTLAGVWIAVAVTAGLRVARRRPRDSAAALRHHPDVGPDTGSVP